MLFIEPLLLSIFGTTPGKAIFGLSVRTDSGKKLTYVEGLERTWGVIGSGFGFNIPIYSLVRLWKSYKICKGNEVQPWDDYNSYTIKDKKWYRPVGCIVAFMLTVAVTLSFVSAQQLPPNRGELTVAQFVENYNYYAKHMGVDFGRWSLNSNGEWVENAEVDVAWNNVLGSAERPTYRFIVKDSFVLGIQFDELNSNQVISLSGYESHMVLATLSFVCAQKDMGLFSRMPGRISNQISGNASRSHQFTEAGITFPGTPRITDTMIFRVDRTYGQKTSQQITCSL